MRVLITGGAGFIGRKLAANLLAKGELAGSRIERIVLADVVAADPQPPASQVEVRTVDITRSGAVMELLQPGFDAIYHLAAVVSGQAETDFEIGMAVNLDSTRYMLEAARHLCDRPRFVFASSMAVYGGELPEVVTDTTHLTPQSSYGAQKAAGELLVADYSRRGYIDGRSLRLPTIVVRPGRPNKATSTFVSSIVREPLNGEQAVCPVEPETKLFCLSPRGIVRALVHGMELPSEAFGMTRSLMLPGLSFSVADALKALERLAGKNVVDRVRFEPDALIRRVVGSWPWQFAPERALTLGFAADADLETIIRQHIDDERGGTFVR